MQLAQTRTGQGPYPTGFLQAGSIHMTYVIYGMGEFFAPAVSFTPRHSRAGLMFTVAATLHVHVTSNFATVCVFCAT